jgi:hypothetical protein
LLCPSCLCSLLQRLRSPLPSSLQLPSSVPLAKKPGQPLWRRSSHDESSSFPEARSLTKSAGCSRESSAGRNGRHRGYYSQAERSLGQLLRVASGILTEAGESAGGVETELGASLRSTLGWLSALAAEGYFRGLGYEVDRNGVPVDPDDLGLAVAQARRTIGIPDVVYPLQFPSKVGREIVGAVSPEAEAQLTQLLQSVPQLAFPTPGVATESQTRKVTTFDPEGRRRVAKMAVPSPLEDFEGWKQAEVSRIARNVAAGRTMGDEFLDAPAVRDWYATIWGDPDAAYYAGSLAEVFVPARHSSEGGGEGR